jgi:hypothetical protein
LTNIFKSRKKRNIFQMIRLKVKMQKKRGIIIIMKRVEQMLLLLLLWIPRAEGLVSFLPRLNQHSQTMQI